jgi:signal transduction histidine kinase
VQPTVAAKSIELEKLYEGVQGEAIMVMGDSNRLQQIVWNLLTNAIKFTPTRGRVKVHLSVVSGNEQPTTATYAQIQVSDTGCGISAEFLPYIFEHFRQADSTSTRSQGGLGLGLAIVRQLVEIHGGTVYAHSPGVGQGTTFTVKLPLLEGSRGRTKHSSARPSLACKCC